MEAAAASRLEFLLALWGKRGPIHVVDVGANPIEGDAPYKPLLSAGLAHVVGFEPQAEALASLLEQKSDQETYLPHALGDGSETPLHIYRHSGFTSIHPAHEANAALVGLQRDMAVTRTLSVPTRRLDDLTEITAVDFLKIDVQGAELSIIGNGRAKLRGALLVQTEVRLLPLYAGEPGFGGLDLELRAQGFQFYGFAFLKTMALRSASRGALKRRYNRQVVDGDAYYLRDLTTMADWDVDQVFRLAVLAETVMDDPGLVLFCLDHLAERRVVPSSSAAEYLQWLPAEAKRS